MAAEASNPVFNEVLQVGIDRSAFQQDLEWMVQAYDDAVASLGEKDGGSGLTKGLSDQVNALLDAITGVGQHLSTLTEDAAQQAEALIDRIDSADAEAVDRQIARQEALAQKRREAAQAGEGDAFQINSIADLLSGAAAGLAQMAQYYAYWKAIQGVIDAISFTIEAPFKAIADGVEYTRGVEQQAELLAGALQTNVKFSNDFAENLKISREVATDLVKLMQDRSIALGVKPEDLQNTFKALLGAGGANLVGSPQELEQLAEMFQSALKSQGVGKLTGQLSNNTLTKLLNGDVTPDNKILQFFNIGDEKWKSMVAEAKEHHDLVAQLAPLVEPYLGALERANVSQAALLEHFTLLKQQMEGMASTGLFNALSDVLKSIDQWMSENKDKIVATLSIFSDGITKIGQSLLSIVHTGGAAFTDMLKLGILLVNELKNDFVAVAQTLELVAKIGRDYVQGGPAAGPGLAIADLKTYYDQQKANVAQAQQLKSILFPSSSVAD